MCTYGFLHPKKKKKTNLICPISFIRIYGLLDVLYDVPGIELRSRGNKQTKKHFPGLSHCTQTLEGMRKCQVAEYRASGIMGKDLENFL